MKEVALIYFVFCLTTTIMILWRAQIPAWRIARPKNMNKLIFWSVLIGLDMLFAPVFFIIMLASNELYKQIIVENLNEYGN